MGRFFVARPNGIFAPLPCKNTDDIGSGNGQSVIINFPRNDLKQSKQSAPPIVKDRVQTSIELMKHHCKSIQFIFDNAGDKNPFIVLEEIRCAERNYEIAKQKLSQ